RQPGDAIARGGAEDVTLLGERLLAIEAERHEARRLLQLRRVRARGEERGIDPAQIRQILNERVQAAVERGGRVPDVGRRRGEEALVERGREAENAADSSAGGGDLEGPEDRHEEDVVAGRDADLAKERTEEEVLLRGIGVVDLVVAEALEDRVVLGEEAFD